MKLTGGPFDGVEVTEAHERGSVLLEGPPLADDEVARYRWSRHHAAFMFRGIDRIVARIPINDGGAS